MSKPVDVGSLREGQFIVVDGEPCRIVEYEKSKPGKHGSAKARIVAMGIFSGTKRTIISPVDAKVEIPVVGKRSGQVISITGNTVQLMDTQSFETFETFLPQDEDLKGKLAPGVEVEYWIILDRRYIVRAKG